MLKTEFEKALEEASDLYTINYTELAEQEVSENITLKEICRQATINHQAKDPLSLQRVALIISLLMLGMGIVAFTFIAWFLLEPFKDAPNLLIVSIVVFALVPAYLVYRGIVEIREYRQFKISYNLPPRVLHFPDASIEALSALLRFYTKYDVFSEDDTIPDIYAVIHPGFRPILINACDCRLEGATDD